MSAQSKAALVGQATEEAKAAVGNQREVKRLKEQLRKLEAKAKKAAPADVEAVQAEIAQCKLDLQSAEGVPATTEPAASSSSPPVSLVGQATEEAKVAVGNQREVKRLKEQLRKLEAKAKKAAPADVEAVQAEIAQCKLDLQSAEAPVDLETVTSTTQLPALVPLETPKTVRNAFTVSGLWGAFSAPPPSRQTVHPRFIEMALRVKRLQLVGGTCRTHAFIAASKVLLVDLFHEHAEERNESMGRFFGAVIRQFRQNCEHLEKARPHSAGTHFVMGEILAFLQKSPSSLSELTAKLNTLAEDFDSANDITDHTRDLIKVDDVILVYGRSAAVEKLLVAAVTDEERAPSKIVVVDGGPLFEGRALTQRLRKLGVEVDYCTLSGLCQVMPSCTRVFIGASLVMQSGDVLNRCGTAMVGAVASQFKVPVVCLCESYKFQRSFWLGSMTSNATVRSDKPLTRAPGTLVASTTVFPDSDRIGTDVSTVGFMYDVTPARFIDLVVHQQGRMHPSAAINQVKENEKLNSMPY